jgi:hypothetical protein
MNYSNSQQQALYSSALSPGHYGSPNHGKFLVKMLTKLPSLLHLCCRRVLFVSNINDKFQECVTNIKALLKLEKNNVAIYSDGDLQRNWR